MADEVFTPVAPFILDDFPIQTDKVTIAIGEGVLAKGTVLGRLASGKYVIVDSSLETSEKDPRCVLAETVDATSADVVATVFLTGSFNEAELVFGGTDTIDTHRDALRDLSIFAKKIIE